MPFANSNTITDDVTLTLPHIAFKILCPCTKFHSHTRLYNAAASSPSHPRECDLLAIIETTQSCFESGFTFCFATTCPNTQQLKNNTLRGIFCWLIYIPVVHIYRQQNLHCLKTFISIDTTPCLISTVIKSVHCTVFYLSLSIDKYNTEVEHSNHMVEGQ